MPDAWVTLTARPCAAFALLYLLSLCVSLGLGLLDGFRASPFQLDADEREYYDLASLAMQGEFSPSARRTLGFPLVIAAIRSIHDDFLIVQSTVTALYALSAPLLFLLVRKVSRSDPAGLLAGAVLAIWPPAAYFGASLYSEALAAPLFLLALLILPTGPTRRWPWVALVSGVLLGLTVHVRPMYLLFLPFMALIAWIEEDDLRQAVRRFAWVAAGFLLPILPWSLAQSARFDRPIFVTSNGGETLAGGLNPHLLEKRTDVRTPSGRITWTGAGKWISIRETGYLSPAEMTLPYERTDELLRDRAFDWAIGHPGQAALIQLSKVSYMWGIYPIGQNGRMQLLFGNLPTLALLALTLWCILSTPGPRRPLVRFWILPLFVTAVALISWGSWRFRQPGDAGLVGFCAIGVIRYVQARLAHSPGRAVADS